MQLSLIIPAHNEEHRLIPTLTAYLDAMDRRYGTQREIIVVANACADRTADLAREAAATREGIRVIDIPEAVGKGGAVLAGFRAARGSYVLFADADAATSPESLLDLADDLEQYDIVIGSRRLPSSTITHRQPLRRRMLGHAFASTVRVLFGMPYQDTQCGAKALRRDAAYQMADLVQERRWAFDVDLLLSARLSGLSVAERPVTWADQQGSSLRPFSTAGQVVPSLWRLKQRHVAAQLTRMPGYAALRG